MVQDHYIAKDPSLIPELVGAGHAWLELIEDAFNLSAEAPGGEIILNGKRGDVDMALAAFSLLEHDLKTTPTLTEGQVRSAISFTKSGNNNTAEHGFTVPKRGMIKARTPGQARYIDILNTSELTFAIGPAGSGKTFLAVAQGVSLLLSGAVQRLVITRPAVEAGERLGFLPGALEDKIDPYLAPIWDSLFNLMGREQVVRRRAAGEIEIAPLAFMRGRTLSNAFILVDEAQNTTRLQMKMLLTRLGYGSRMVVTGDPSQIDLPDPQQSGLLDAMATLDGVEDIHFAHLGAEDIVRHVLVNRIVAAYDAKMRG